MDFIKMIMELPGEKRSQDVVEHTEWNSLWKLIVTQGNHSENYLEQLYDYFFNKEGWVQIYTSMCSLYKILLCRRP